MKPEKGQPVFIDNVDILLTDKIIDHTNKNTDEGARGKKQSSGSPSHRKEAISIMSKPKWIVWAVVGLLIVAGIIACFTFCRGGCCGKKK